MNRYEHLRGEFSLLQVRTRAQRLAHKDLPSNDTPEGQARRKAAWCTEQWAVIVFHSIAAASKIYHAWQTRRLNWPRSYGVRCTFGCDLFDVDYRTMTRDISAPTPRWLVQATRAHSKSLSVSDQMENISSRHR